MIYFTYYIWCSYYFIGRHFCDFCTFFIGYKGSTLLQPVLPVALSLTLIVQGFICTQLAMNMCRTDIERGICGVMGAVLAIQGAAWGLAVGLILFFMLFEGKKKASEQVAVGAADDKANQ